MSLGALWIPIRATADQFAADAQNIRQQGSQLAAQMTAQTDAIVASWGKTGVAAQDAVEKMQRVSTIKAAVKDLEGTTGALVKGWGKTKVAVQEAADASTHSIGDAHSAAKGLERMIGIQLPNAAGRFLSESKTIGPLLAGAFSGVAVFGMIQALGQLPALFAKIEAAITGWDEAAKKAFADILVENKKAVDALESFRLKLIEVQGTGLTGSARQVVGMQAIALAIDDQRQANERLLKTISTLGESEKKMNSESQFTHDRRVKAIEVAIAASQKLADEGGAKLLELQRQQTIAAKELNITQGQEAVKAAQAAQDANKKMATEQLKAIGDLRKAQEQFQFQANLDLFKGSFGQDDIVGRIMEDLKKTNALMTGPILDAGKEWHQWMQNLDADARDLIERYDTMRGILEDMAEQTKRLFPIVPLPQGAIPDPTPNLDSARKAIDQISDDISRMFTGMIANGKSFWEAFKNLGQTVIASVFDTVFKSALDSLLNHFQLKIEKLIGMIKANATTLALAAGGAAIGAAATHGSVGGTVAGAAAGAAVGEALKGDWIGATIAGVVAVGAAFTSFIGRLRRMANELVKNFQDPLTKATTDMFNQLDKLRTAGTLTMADVADASAGFEQMWADFQKQAETMGIVGQKGLATMTPFVEQWRVWLDDLKDAAKELERLAAVKEFSDRVTKAADSIPALNEAITQLYYGGYSAEAILAILGGDIDAMTAAAKLLNIELPSSIQFMNEFSAALKAMDRVKAIDAELLSIGDQIADAFRQKMDLLDSEMQKAEDNIQNWSDQIRTLDDQISSQQKTLSDAVYWQKAYDDTVKDSADNLQQLTDKRKSLEDQIQRLAAELQRDALVEALDRAKAQGQAIAQMVSTTFTGITKAGHAFTATMSSSLNSGGNLSGVAAAQAALDAFDKQQNDLAKAAKIQELSDLKRQLAETIALQARAEQAYAEASVAAQEHIQALKDEMAASIELAKSQRDTLEANIILEGQRLEALRMDSAETARLMDVMGVSRLSELGKINQTIGALFNRASALDQERASLEAVYGATLAASTAIATLIASLRTASAIRATPQISSLSPGFGTLPFPFPSFDTGGYVARTGIALVHEGERVQPAEKQMSGRNGGDGLTIILNIKGDVYGKREFIDEITDEIKRKVERGSVRFASTEVRR